jgi:hypothetical protein
LKTIIISLIAVAAVGFGLAAAWNTRQIQHRMQCAANLERIAAALKDDQLRHGTRPTALDDLLGAALHPVELRCPATRERYTYHDPRSAAADVLVHESADNHRGGGHMLFSDFRVQFVPPEHRERHLGPARP